MLSNFVIDQDIDPAENLIKSAKPVTVESQADLHCIIRYGDINQLTAALKKKYNPLDKDVLGYTALHIAALYGKLELMKHLMEEEQLYPTVPGPKKATPLIAAAGSGNLSIVKYLIEEQHIDPSADRDEDGYLAIHRACQNSKLSVVKYLFEKSTEVCLMEAKDIFCDFTKDDTAILHIAALSGNIDTVKYFTEECKCDTNLCNEAGRTALFHACQYGNLEVVKYLVEVGNCRCSLTDSSLNTPLHLAAQHDNLPVVQYLLEERKCDANPKNSQRNTPLLEASYAGQLNIVKYLLENGCNPKAYGSNGYNCLHAACSAGHMDMVQYLIEDSQMDPCASISKEKCTCSSKTNALHIASQYGHTFVLDYLIEKRKMDPNLPDEDGNSSLDLAVVHNQVRIVYHLLHYNKCDPRNIPQSLLKQVKDTRICYWINTYKWVTLLPPALPQGELLKSDFALNTVKRLSKKELRSFVDKFNRRLIHIAVEYGRLDIVKFLIEENIFKADLEDAYQFTPLHLAAEKGHVDIFKYLVEECKCDPKCKIPINLGDQIGGATPLHLAAREGRLSMVKHILESDYRIHADAETHNGVTPLQFATIVGRIDIIEYLIKKHNCNPSHKDRKLRTALSFAAGNFHLDALRFLIEKMKCDPNVCDVTGKSIIHIAALRGSLDIVKYLVSECGIDPNSRTAMKQELTVIHFAAAGGHPHIVKYLSQLPNSTAHETFAKLTPLHVASACGQCEVVKYLVQKFKNSELQCDNYGNVPLHFAAYGGQFEVVKFLCKEMGTSPAVKNKNNETPLYLALQNGHSKVALYLIVLLYFECQDSIF